MNPSVGIGVITVQKRAIHANILNLISMPTHFFVYPDTERRGPATGRNECIKNLYEAGCEYFFLFDDDTYPVYPGWQDYFIEESKKSGIQCFGYPDIYNKRLLGVQEGIGYWQWNTGAFTFLTRKAVEEIGYFNIDYKRYGHEDVAYLARVRASGLGGQYPHADAAPIKINSYIYSEDVLGIPEPVKGGEANMSAEDKNKWIEENRAIFDADMAAGKVFQPYRRAE
jgi:hypothetical protein